MYYKRFHKKVGRRLVTYVSIAHNLLQRRPGKEPQTLPVILLNLGRETRAGSEQREATLAMAEALYRRRIEMGDSPAAAVAAVKEQLRPAQAPMAPVQISVKSSREFGMRLLLDKVWEELGAKAAFLRFQAQHGVKFPLERVVFGMVLNRLVDPRSKRACNEWLKDLAYFPEADEKWSVQHFYRAMDILHDHWEEVEEILFQSLWSRLPEEAKGFFLVDTTSMFFEMVRSDEELAEVAAEHVAADLAGTRPPMQPFPQVVNEPAFRMRGKNKDGHDQDPQVVVASIVTPNGFIVRHKVYPGNTNDKTIGKDLIANLPAPEGVIKVWFSDSGMVSDEPLVSIDLAGWHRLTASPLRNEPFAQDRLLSGAGRYLPHKDDPKFSFREEVFSAEELAMGRAEKWVIVRNAAERERQIKRLEKQKATVMEELAKQREANPHGRQMCEVAVHKSMKKFVRPSDKVPGQFVFAADIYQRERMLAGTRLLRTTFLTWDAQDVHSGYQLLLQVEEDHRTLKTPLRLRPCYHRADHRIKAHVMLNVLAINCLRFIQQQTGLKESEIRALTERVSAVELRQGNQQWWQCSDLPKDYTTALKTLKIKRPPPTWTAWREEA